jgi:hypothetical protein
MSEIYGGNRKGSIGRDYKVEGEKTYVTEAVPLGTTLGVEVVYVVVGDILYDGFDFVLESFAIE